MYFTYMPLGYLLTKTVMVNSYTNRKILFIQIFLTTNENINDLFI